MRLLHFSLGFFLLAASSIRAESAHSTLFATDFEFPKFAADWRNEGNGHAELETRPDQSRRLLVQNAAIGNHLVSIPVPVAPIRGMRAIISAKIQADDVSKPPEPWNGIKLMLVTQSPRGPEYQGAMDLFGSFAEKEVGLPVFVPADATSASLVLGLQDSRGTVRFDDVTLKLSAAPRTRPAEPKPLPEQLDRRSDLPRLRGVMYGPKGKAEDLEKLAEWNANLIRWQFYWYDGSFPEKRLDLARYDRWLEETIAEVDRFLPLCEKLGIRVVIDLHTPPGAGTAAQWAMFSDAAYQQKFIEVWDRLATHFRDKPAVWAYDLINEPIEGQVAEGLMDWRTLAEFVAKRVRAIDPKRAIIIEPGPSGGWGNLPYFEPIPVPGIVYSVHVYDPIQFTHQGILAGMPKGVSYPGIVNGVHWDKAKLKETLAPVREYQMDYGVPIYIGEFSAPRWAPDGSAERYLRDCLAIFEEFGWDWSYHAFREWHGWNVEIEDGSADPKPAATPTGRERALREGLNANGRMPRAPGSE